jgi:quercetin dioxygenase-like cupin family protein
MISEQQQELASLYAFDALSGEERAEFEASLRADPELREFARSLQKSADALVLVSPLAAPSAALREKVLSGLPSKSLPASGIPGLAGEPGFAFHGAHDPSGWKELDIKGAWIKLLSIDHTRGYAVLLGKLEPGVRYPPHVHHGSEDLYILSGDLHLGDRTLRPGDFHHSDSGTSHGVNHSVEGCTLMAVVPADHELVQFALTTESH